MLIPLITLSIFPASLQRHYAPLPELPPIRNEPLAASDVTIRLPPIRLPGAVVVLPPNANPSLVVNTQRSTHRDIGGFGPMLRNMEKKARGIRNYDMPVCTNEAHETNRKRKNVFRKNSTCRGCVKDAVESIPPHATKWQIARYVNALFRCYFCPFCILESPRDKMHQVSAKMRCAKHYGINRHVKCSQHNTEWAYCKECVHDLRSANYFCPCGKRKRAEAGCTCPPELSRLSYGVRLHTNPFAVPTEEVRAQEEAWTVAILAEADRESGVEIPSKSSNYIRSYGKYVTPRLV
jgi:hypothetical protein